MHMQEKNFTYYYTTNALGLGGVLKHPDGATTIVPSLASVVLPSTGGEGFNEVMNYNHGGISFSSARSSVLGYDTNRRTFTTRAEAYITNLNLFGRLKADILQTSIISTRDVRPDRDIQSQSNPDNVRFTVQAMIRGLTIDDVEVIPELDLELSECRTYKQLAERLAAKLAGKNGGKSGSKSPRKIADRYAPEGNQERDEQEMTLPANARPILASCFRAIRHQPTEKFGPSKDFKLPVKDFGNVYFGELIVKPGTRHVNLLRIEFDSPHAFGKSYPRKRRVVAQRLMSAPTVDETETTSDEPMATFAAAAGSTYDGGTMTLLSHDSNGVPIWP